MNIKSLLLGSAAALVAASGAYAADAVDVIAEPEPMDYVRICDTYGEGYFYIPGTESCLRVGGYVRYDARVDDDGGLFSGTQGGDTYDKRARFSLQISTASETELGTLRTYTETRFNFTNGGNDRSSGFFFQDREDDDFDGDFDEDGDVDLNDVPRTVTGDVDLDDTEVSLNFAYIQLGGFRVGKDESLFTTFTGYAGGVILDDLIPYGPFDTNLISYTFDAGNGFSAAVALEEGYASDEIDDYVPHIVVGAKYTLGFGTLSGVVGYDSANEEVAGKVRLDVNVNEQFNAFVMGGYKTDDGEQEDFDDVSGDGDFLDDDGESSDGTNFYGNWQGNNDDCDSDGDCDDDGFVIFGGASYTFNDKATLNAQAAYDGGENFAISANVAYELVPGFKITPEIAYIDNFDDDESILDDEDEGSFGGLVRFQRSF